MLLYNPCMPRYLNAFRCYFIVVLIYNNLCKIYKWSVVHVFHRIKCLRHLLELN